MTSRCLYPRSFKLIFLSAALIFMATVLHSTIVSAQPNPVLGNGVSCSDVQTNAQSSGVDPDDLQLTDLPPASTCPTLVDGAGNILVAYGFNYQDADVWHADDGNLYICVRTHGQPGDANGDGGYTSQIVAGPCGGIAAGCTIGESDALNVFAQGLEEVSFLVDRDCDGNPDLKFAISGPSLMVVNDFYTGHTGENLGSQGTAWQAAPLFSSPDTGNPDFVCDPANRKGAVIFCIPNWQRYFENPTPSTLNLFQSRFDWIVDSGNLSDSYPEDKVPGTFEVINPCIDLSKSADPTSLCGLGSTTRFSLTVTNCGNVPLSNVVLSDTLPVGLDYDNDFIDDPTHTIGLPGQVGQILTWNPFTLDPGEIITVSFRAASNTVCSGTQTNSSEVSGQYQVDCLGPDPFTVGPITKTADVICESPCVLLSEIRDTTACVDETVNVPVTVTNCSSLIENITVVCTVNGVALDPPLPTFMNVAAGAVNAFVVPVLCTTTGPVTVSCTATAEVVGSPTCTAMDTKSGTVTCREACAEFVQNAPDDTVCVGETSTVPFTVRNCATEDENFSVSCTIDGISVGDPEVFMNVGNGGTETVNVDVTCTTPGTHEVICVATATLVADPPACVAVARDTVLVKCLGRDVEITKTVTPTTTAECTQVTIEVHNTGESILDPVNVSDILPAGLAVTLVAGDVLDGTCGATVAAVTPMGDLTVLTFEPLTLGLDERCTIIYDICCDQFDGQSRVDTAKVEAWCQGTFDLVPPPMPATDQDTALVVCQGMGGACPHTIGFWRQQCAQKGNGSTKICREGMEALWRCVIDATNVTFWEKNDGRVTSTTALRALPNTGQFNLFDSLCVELQGPRPMTIRNMAEIQYLGLMLNVCVGSMPLDTPIDSGLPGINTVGDAITAIENSLNTNTDLSTWKTLADNLNNRMGVLAPDCVNSDSLYSERPECPVTALQPVDLGTNGLDVTRLSARAMPNPVRNGVTTILFSIPEGMDGTRVALQVFDITGRLVKTLVSDVKDVGSHTADWDLTDSSGRGVPAGVFFYTLTAGSERVTEKMLVLRR